MVASPPRWHEPQARALWHHEGHGAVGVVGPVAPPGRASGRGDAGVCTDRRKWPLGAVLGHLCTLLRRCGQAWGRRSVHRSAKMASRRRFGAFVYTVATLWAGAGTQECTQIGENGLSAQPPLACRMRPLVTSGWRRRRRVRLSVSRRLQSGALVYAVATQFAEASTHTNPRRAQLLRGYYTSSGLTAGRCGLQRRTRRQRPARSGTPRRSGPPSDPRSFGSWNSRNAPRRRGSPCSRPGRVRK